MIDLRRSNQRFKGFYIFKETCRGVRGYAVGKNGTSCHTFFPAKPGVKQEIINFILENSQKEL